MTEPMRNEFDDCRNDYANVVNRIFKLHKKAQSAGDDKLVDDIEQYWPALFL